MNFDNLNHIPLQKQYYQSDFCIFQEHLLLHNKNIAHIKIISDVFGEESIFEWEHESYSYPINSKQQRPHLKYSCSSSKIIYSSSNPNIVSIDNDGQMKYINEGTVTLTATYIGEYIDSNILTPQKSVSCTLTITTADYLLQPLTIISLEDNNIIELRHDNLYNINTYPDQINYGSCDRISISLDNGQTWQSIDLSNNTILANINKNESIQIICGVDNHYDSYYGNGSLGFNGLDNSYGRSMSYHVSHFYSSKKINVEGNILSLTPIWSKENELYNQINCYTNTTHFGFKCLFQNCINLISAKKLILPLELSPNTYEGMFQYMFKSCTSLIEAPKLLATTLSPYCYSRMFQYCTSLTSAPELPATTLADGCYRCMFYGCTSLTTASELPATTLASSCYMDMFSGCTSLNYIKCLATDISANYCTSSWVSGVAQSGTFIKNSKATFDIGPSGIPTGWEVIDEEVPEE